MSEIVVYAQITKNGLNPETAELVTAAQEVAKFLEKPSPFSPLMTRHLCMKMH